MSDSPTAVDGASAAAIRAAGERSAERLLAARTGAHWTGRLSSSALATATAAAALRLVDRGLGTAAHRERVAAGAAWLRATQLADGGWGDTPESPANLSTTLLAWSVLAALDEDAGTAAAGTARAAAWIAARAGGTAPEQIAGALEAIYGRDRTFAVPILVHATLCGRLGDPSDPATWRVVPQLPFELATLPQSWFRLVDLQVVSYALPALVAIGQVRHVLGPGGFPARLVRSLSRAPTLRTLRAIQPSGGGYLEATPLTSFVTMSLAGMGQAGHAVARDGARFLAASQRDCGAWPIDTNLATWCTTLAVGGLAAGGRLGRLLGPGEREATRDWLLGQRWSRRHPYTGAAPGGWAWTDLPGGVPDADDTSGGVVALAALEAAERRDPPAVVRAAGTEALGWLEGLANRDGGIPTFCRGWGRLPFDTSCPDITAHFLRAASAWRGLAAAGTRAPSRAEAAARRYLDATRRPDGAWWPLWFGNQRHPEQANPVYGTARVVLATRDPRGTAFLLAAQAPDGGFPCAAGMPATIEETAVAVEALAAVACAEEVAAAPRRLAHDACLRGAAWLVEHSDGGRTFPAAPIGLYFAKLWYDEALYPLLFTVAALERVGRLLPADTAR